MDKNFTKTTINKTNKTNLTKVNKNKDDKLVIRIDSKLKEQFTEYVENKGATVSDYLRQMIVDELHNNDKLLYQFHKAQAEMAVTSVKEYLDDYHNPELNIYKEIETLKEKLTILEYRMEQRERSEKSERPSLKIGANFNSKVINEILNEENKVSNKTKKIKN